MHIEYKPLANVPTTESLGDTDTVLVVSGGEVKKTAKSNVGGGGGGDGGATFKVVTITESEGTRFINEKAKELYDAYPEAPVFAYDVVDGIASWERVKMVSYSAETGYVFTIGCGEYLAETDDDYPTMDTGGGGME